MSQCENILPDDKVFADFRRQCYSMDNWHSKYDKNGMEVWVETAPQGSKKAPAKVHKIKVSRPTGLIFFFLIGS